MKRILYDALIIGGGPAGLSTALGLGRVKRTAVLFDSHSYRNEGIEHVHAILSRDGIHPQTFRDIGKQQIVDKYHSIEFVDTEIVHVRKAQVEPGYEGFEAENSRGEVWKGRKLVLATGSKEIFPDIEGFGACWPGGIYQCLFCDGFERASTGENRPIGVLILNGQTKFAMHYALQCFSFSSDVTVMANGPAENLEGFADLFAPAAARGCKLEERRITRLIPLPGVEGVKVQFETGEDLTVCFLTAKPKTEPKSKSFVDQLGLTLHPKEKGGDIEVDDPFCQSTSVKGCFVPGDAGKMLKHGTYALQSGVAVAGGIHNQLCGEEGLKAMAKLSEKK